MKKWIYIVMAAGFVISGCSTEAKYNEYIKANKVAEAKVNLKLIGDAALLFFEADHMRDDESTIYTEEYPKSEAVQIGPSVDETTIGVKYTPKEADFTQVWKSLYFDASRPLYYTYYYISDGKTFKAKAAASIIKACDSVFIIEGDANGVISDVKDVSDSGNCDSLTLP